MRTNRPWAPTSKVPHRAPTKNGQSVTETPELLEVKKNKPRYAMNDQGAKIGEGWHRRALINSGRFGKMIFARCFRR